MFFDSLQIKHYTGPLIEETHYNAWGMTLAGISSQAIKPKYTENKYLFNGGNELQNKEFSDGSGLDWYDATFRMYDPQIGRFHQIDPLAEFFGEYSPYTFANNNPILLNDPLGLSSDTPRVSGSGFTPETSTILPEVIVNVVKPDCKTCSSSSGNGSSQTVIPDPTSQVNTVVEKVADVVTDFIPLVSGGKDIYKGIRDGNWWQVGIGVGSIVLDVFTLGSSSILKGAVKTAIREGAELALKNGTKTTINGGLNLFKKGSEEALKQTGWRAGDRFLRLQRIGITKLDWKQNSRLLRQEMRSGNPIFDSYRLPNGALIPANGFLNAERTLLQNRGWNFDVNLGAWLPPR
jgi:RHS repeat-associated protein